MQKASDPATLLYSRLRAARFRLRVLRFGGQIGAHARDNLTLAPAATRSGCKAHTVPPL